MRDKGSADQVPGTVALLCYFTSTLFVRECCVDRKDCWLFKAEGSCDGTPLKHGDVQAMEHLRWVIKSAAVLAKSSAITTDNGLPLNHTDLIPPHSLTQTLSQSASTSPHTPYKHLSSVAAPLSSSEEHPPPLHKSSYSFLHSPQLLHLFQHAINLSTTSAPIITHSIPPSILFLSSSQRPRSTFDTEYLQGKLAVAHHGFLLLRNTSHLNLS